MKLVKVRVQLNELHAQVLEVGEWEVPILEVVHGSADVEVVGEVEVDRELPDAASEYARLEQRYGRDREEGGLPYVAQVYGQHGAGVRSLEKAIEGSQPVKTVNLARLKVDELRVIAAEFGLPTDGLTREQLIEAIRESQAKADAAAAA